MVIQEIKKTKSSKGSRSHLFPLIVSSILLLSHHLPYANKISKEFSLTCINNSKTPKYFYLFFRYTNQPDELSSLVWCVSESKIGEGVEITFRWNMIYSAVWQGYGNIQPGFIGDATKYVPILENKNSFTFSCDNNTPLLKCDNVLSNPDIIAITSKYNVPTKKYGVGIGIDEKVAFLYQVKPNKKYVFSKILSFFIGCSDDILEGEVLSKSNIDPKKELNIVEIPGVNSEHLTFNGTEFLQKEE